MNNISSILNCPHCDREHRITPVLKNKIIRCPYCNNQFCVFVSSAGMKLLPVLKETIHEAN